MKMADFLFVLSVCRSAIYLRYMRKEQVISGAEAIRRMQVNLEDEGRDLHADPLYL